VVLSSIICLSIADCGPWVPLDINTIKPASPSDQVDVYYLIAPLMECQYNNDFSYIDAYHGGLAIINRNSGMMITLNYDAVPSFTQALIPNIITYSNGTKDLQWSNQGSVFIYNGVNETYWNANIELVANINGTVFNQYMTWLAKYNSTYPYYDLWAVYTEWPGKNLWANQECFTFVWESMDFLRTQGVGIVPSEAYVGILSLFSGSVPTKVDMTNPSSKSDVVKFYVDMNNKLNSLGVLGFIEVMLDMMLYPHYYIHTGNDYYEVKLYYPYVGTIYDYMPTPK